MPQQGILRSAFRTCFLLPLYSINSYNTSLTACTQLLTICRTHHTPPLLFHNTLLFTRNAPFPFALGSLNTTKLPASLRCLPLAFNETEVVLFLFLGHTFTLKSYTSLFTFCGLVLNSKVFGGRDYLPFLFILLH